MNSPESFDLSQSVIPEEPKKETVERIPFYISKLNIKDTSIPESVFQLKGIDPNISLGTAYNLYVDDCLKQGTSPSWTIDELSLITMEDKD